MDRYLLKTLTQSNPKAKMKTAPALGKIVAFTAFALAALGAGLSNAWAGWVQIGDADTQDSATNPGYPSNENPLTVGAYLQDLLDLPSAPALLVVGDHYAGDPLTGLGDPTLGNSLLLSFHFGNGNDYWPHTSNFDVFFSCMSDCGTFTLPSTKAISNYRLYGSTDVVHTNQIPEPLTLSLLGIGLAGLGLSRRRARS